MFILMQFIITVVVFFAVGYFSWAITEKKRNIPEFLEYKPFECRTCLNFWLLTGIYIALGVSFKWYILLIAGIILAILNAIAMVINQKNKTIKL